MKEETITLFEKLFYEIGSQYGIIGKKIIYSGRKHFMDKLRIEQAQICQALENLINDFEAYSFTKTDKILRFKAPDIYKMEMERIQNDILESKTNLKSYIDDPYIISIIDSID